MQTKTISLLIEKNFTKDNNEIETNIDVQNTAVF